MLISSLEIEEAEGLLKEDSSPAPAAARGTAKNRVLQWRYILALFTLCILALIMVVCLVFSKDHDFMYSLSGKTKTKTVDLASSELRPFSTPGGANDFFNGTSVEQWSGTILYRHVCLQRNQTRNQLISYSLTGEPVRPPNATEQHIPPLPSSVFNWVLSPVGKTMDEWKTDRKTFFVPGNTVLLSRIYGSNIAHCISDEIFSLAPDMSRLWNCTESYYPNFVYFYMETHVSQSVYIAAIETH